MYPGVEIQPQAGSSLESRVSRSETALWQLPPLPRAASLAWFPPQPDAVFSLMPNAGRLFDSLLLFLPRSFFTQLSQSAAALFLLSLCLQNSRLEALKSCFCSCSPSRLLCKTPIKVSLFFLHPKPSTTKPCHICLLVSASSSLTVIENASF